MISPVIFFNLVMAIIGALQVFDTPFMMTQGGPNRASYLYTYYLYDNAFAYLHMGYASAMAWIQLLLVLALTGDGVLVEPEMGLLPGQMTGKRINLSSNIGRPMRRCSSSARWRSSRFCGWFRRA